MRMQARGRQGQRGLARAQQGLARWPRGALARLQRGALQEGALQEGALQGLARMAR